MYIEVFLIDNFIMDALIVRMASALCAAPVKAARLALFSLIGTALAFARAVGEFGSVALIGGNLPGRTQVTSQYIAQRIEVGDPAGAAAVSVTLLAVSVSVLVALRLLARDARTAASG